MEAAEALRRIAFLLERRDGSSRRSRAFRTAAESVDAVSPDELRRLKERGKLRDLRGIGASTASVVEEALDGHVPPRLAQLEDEAAEFGLDGEARRIREALRGDCHTHSEWSDGNTSIEEMALTARELGHDYMVLTDHSPRLRIANGLSAERLEQQLEDVAALNKRLAPFRILTGIEVDILEDGTLDQRDDLLARLDIVVASVHSKLRMPGKEMTERMLAAIRNPHMDILGHCTGRKLRSRGGRPESEFDARRVFEACVENGKAVEINCQLDRRDPPRRLLRQANELGCFFSIDSDGHAPGELDWIAVGCERAAECKVDPERIVTTWEIDRLLEWSAGHGNGAK